MLQRNGPAVWNTLAGTFQFLWNAVVAVATFFVAAVVWLANVAIGLTIGLVTGNWTYFETNVVEPFKKAVEAFFKFITDFLLAAINWVFSPLIQAYNEMQQAMLSAAMFAVDPPQLSDVLNVLLAVLFFSAFAVFLIAAFIAVRVILRMTESFGWGWVVGLVVGAIVGAFVGIKIADIVYGNRIQEVIPKGFDDQVDWAFTATSFILGLGVTIAALARLWKTIGKAVVGLWAAVISFMILGVSTSMSARGDRLGLEVAFFLDIVAVLVALAGLDFPLDILPDYSLLNPVASALGYASLVTSFASMADDGVKFMTHAGP